MTPSPPDYNPARLTGPAADAAAAITNTLGGHCLTTADAATLTDHLIVTVLCALPTEGQNRAAAEMTAAMVTAAEDYTGVLSVPDPACLDAVVNAAYEAAGVPA